MKIKNVHLVGEILFARVVPGALNLLTIILIGRYLTAAEYGEFSLIFATITLFVSLILGPLEQAILPLHARNKLKNNQNAFERQVLGAALSVVGISGIFALGILLIGYGNPVWVVLFAVSALSGVLQPLLRARLQFWQYGAAASIKAVAALALVIIFLSQDPNVSVALMLYAIGVGIGGLAAWFMTGRPLPQLPSRGFMREVMPIGSGLTLSTMAEAVLFVGTRYAISFFGTPQFLGIFSFALDLAQRSVGVVINITSFAIIPRAYLEAAKGDNIMLRKILMRAALSATFFSIITFWLIIILQYFGFISKYMGDNFSYQAFFAISIAVFINRLKKLAVDPILVNIGRISIILKAYIYVGPPFLIFVAFLLHFKCENWVLIIYPASYLLIACFTLFAVRATLEN